MSTLNATTIKVSTIQSANGISAMTIDSNGRVNFPNTVAFWAAQGSNGGLVAAGKYTFEYAIYNKGNGYSTGTSRFTAPVTGLYYFISTLELYSLASASGIAFYKNGAITNGLANAWPIGQAGAVPDHEIMTSSCVLELSTNDYVEVYTFAGARGMQSQWVGYLIG